MKKTAFCYLRGLCALFLCFLWPVPASAGQDKTPETSTEQKRNQNTPEGEKKSGFPIKPGSADFNTYPGSELIEYDRTNDAPEDAASSASDKPKKRYEIAASPIPVINPTIGNGLGGVGMLSVYLNPRDTKSPPSTFMGGLMFTDNGSWAYGFLSQLYLKEDRFRILGAIGDYQLNFDYYGTGNDNGQNDLFLPLSMDGVFFMIEPKIRFFKDWYAGPRYLMLNSTVKLDRDKLEGEIPEFPLPPDSLVEIPEMDLKVQSAALGVRIQRDTRDSQIYPRKGTLLDSNLDFYNSDFGSDRDYRRIEVSFQGFLGFGTKNVLAYRGSICSVSGDAPFYGQCMLGKAEDIRGYSMGRYQDRRMLVGQVEYRRELFWRFGAVGYFGAGQVADSFDVLKAENILPGGGIGGRITLAKQNHINLRVDYAWGKESTAFYVSMQEAF